MNVKRFYCSRHSERNRVEPRNLPPLNVKRFYCSRHSERNKVEPRNLPPLNVKRFYCSRHSEQNKVEPRNLPPLNVERFYCSRHSERNKVEPRNLPPLNVERFLDSFQSLGMTRVSRSLMLAVLRRPHQPKPITHIYKVRPIVAAKSHVQDFRRFLPRAAAPRLLALIRGRNRAPGGVVGW